MHDSSHHQGGPSCSTCGHQHHHDEEAQQEERQLRNALQQIRHKLLVMSGKGGVGKSSVAVTLALALAWRGFKVGIMDVDLHGPNVLRMLGLREALDLTHGSFVLPGDLSDNLKVISIEALMQNRDSAVIWRGPLKHRVIQQFITDVEWGQLDYLIIDSPPGTGDEPLSVAQTIPDAQAIIVTTPQEISLADVRKSINFCRKVNMKILGLVENMSHLICPKCGEQIPLFKSGGGEKTAQVMKVPLLGSLPFDYNVVEAGDAGQMPLLKLKKSPYLETFKPIVDNIVEILDKEAAEKRTQARQPGTAKFAFPLENGRLAEHFGHAQQYALLTVQDHNILNQEVVTPPPHEPGVLPAWMEELEVTHIFAAGMGSRAQALFQQKGIEVITGAPLLSPEELLQQYFDKSLVTGPNVCDH
ncbi:MAG: P-loop NTPase [Deltaproteobacteria bacterium]|nr:P-loop NTPase [Deltaproteobacteria bacterium]MBW1985703.1 P-loop NTPase [Deltaproteobacteria bacterium]MBW2134617.1 P-loop NTPase [Deltaproteobacteria bacterium]